MKKTLTARIEKQKHKNLRAKLLQDEITYQAFVEKIIDAYIQDELDIKKYRKVEG